MEKLITVRQAAELIGFKESTIQRWVRLGYLKGYRRTPKSAIRLRIKDLEELMQSGSKIAEWKE